MLKHRLLFGSLMTVLFSGLVLLDGWFDGSLTASPADDRQVQATLLTLLVAGILSLGGLELSRLAAAKGLVVLNPVCAIGLILLSTAWYWPQRRGHAPGNVSPGGYSTCARPACLSQQHAIRRQRRAGQLRHQLLLPAVPRVFWEPSCSGFAIDGGLWAFLAFHVCRKVLLT